MRTGRPKAELMLTADERHTLEQWTRRPIVKLGSVLGTFHAWPAPIHAIRRLKRCGA